MFVEDLFTNAKISMVQRTLIPKYGDFDDYIKPLFSKEEKKEVPKVVRQDRVVSHTGVTIAGDDPDFEFML